MGDSESKNKKISRVLGKLSHPQARVMPARGESERCAVRRGWEDRHDQSRSLPPQIDPQIGSRNGQCALNRTHGSGGELLCNAPKANVVPFAVATCKTTGAFARGRHLQRRHVPRHERWLAATGREGATGKKHRVQRALRLHRWPSRVNRHSDPTWMQHR